MGGRVFVGGDGRAKAYEAEVLEEVIEHERAGVSLFPPGVSFGEEVGGKGAEAKEVVRSVEDHVDGQIIAGEEEKVGSKLVF